MLEWEVVMPPTPVKQKIELYVALKKQLALLEAGSGYVSPDSAKRKKRVKILLEDIERVVQSLGPRNLKRAQKQYQNWYDTFFGVLYV